MFWVYILHCEDGSHYTGMTDDVKKRIHTHYHRLKNCAKYTRSHKVDGLCALWLCDCESAARKLEFRIKKLTKEKKLLLINEPERVSEFFPALSEYSCSPVTDIKFEDCI
ncbi:MAG: GIY-YIG nuclease family protein [Oscillospiraceae bacterium]|nr:GIY-YIG nuclease family protein [Oscillospiraceae bacterium]